MLGTVDIVGQAASQPVIEVSVPACVCAYVVLSARARVCVRVCVCGQQLAKKQQHSQLEALARSPPPNEELTHNGPTAGSCRGQAKPSKKETHQRKSLQTAGQKWMVSALCTALLCPPFHTQALYVANITPCVLGSTPHFEIELDFSVLARAVGWAQS